MRTIALLIAFFIGSLCPWLGKLAGLIPFFIIFMLFSVFLRLRPGKDSLRPSHFLLAGANIVIPLLLWGFFKYGFGVDDSLTQALYFSAASPTATASPVIIALIGGSTVYGVTAFILSNLAFAVCTPLILPHILGSDVPGLTGSILLRVALLTLIPLFLALLLRSNRGLGLEGADKLGHRLGMPSFYAWAIVVTIITAKASDFIQTNHPPTLVLLLTLAFSLIACVTNFSIGYFLDRSGYSREASQCLGQKNTSYTIDLALVYASPLVALGPTFYSLWQNLWNAFLIHKAAKRAKRQGV